MCCLPKELEQDPDVEKHLKVVRTSACLQAGLAFVFVLRISHAPVVVFIYAVSTPPEALAVNVDVGRSIVIVGESQILHRVAVAREPFKLARFDAGFSSSVQEQHPMATPQRCLKPH